ncbi:phospholipid carrier-dependent glycosyltransferase [Paludisphaera sp.]|uniref:phospholipid carrier-dependent glycosyltransferase n=1 Tax=Paludisphaera sp. TaxID=2017432 RepID=UPI00301DCD8A
MTSDNRWARRGPALAALAAALARLAVILADGARFDDPDNYLPLARAVASGDGLTFKGRATAYRPPLYPVILAPLTVLEGDRPRVGLTLLHVALGAGTAALAVVAARRLGASPRRALVAGLIVAYDPVLAWQAKSAMTETLAAFLAALAVALAAGRRPVVAGGALGLASLARPSLLPGAGLVALAAAIFAPGDRRERLRRAGLLAVGVGGVMLPWGARNQLAMGEFVVTTTHGGYTLALANNEVYYRQVLDGPPGAVWTGPEQREWWDDVNRRMAGLPEPEADRRLRDEVVALARREPRTFARACLSRLATFWSPLPAAGVYGTTARLATFVWTAPLWIALALGLARREFRSWPGVAAPALIVGLTVVHAFYWTDLRMRAPIVPAIAVVAALATVGRRRS